MTHSPDRKNALRRSIAPLLGSALLLCASLAAAQKNLGELLDAGANKLSAEEFKQELVQRVIVGQTASGGNLEVMYTTKGTIQGNGTNRLFTGVPFTPIRGEWKIDDSGKVCTSMQYGDAGTGQSLPYRCQVWFKYGEQYFLADSDTDRSARVLRRTIKQ